ncbi:hypothetical protein C2845_PM17G09610 [Panicum miliaceum]|uniref:Uncharacterized protein n=1 Tax=Panicum miliaceum TaxID=4540 RepID=A0A3L6Q3Z1_PANMI|nr:hypothetical protein C2845_PM17G09610 [Panicum miliaceum]
MTLQKDVLERRAFAWASVGNHLSRTGHSLEFRPEEHLGLVSGRIRRWIKKSFDYLKLRNARRKFECEFNVDLHRTQKMEEDLIAKGIVPVTFNWPLRAMYFFYAHGGTLDPEDGSFVTTDRLREAAARLETALQAVQSGTLKPNREKDELTYILGTPEHTGRVQDMGVVPWKHGFNADIDTY